MREFAGKERAHRNRYNKNNDTKIVAGTECLFNYIEHVKSVLFILTGAGFLVS